MPQIVYDLKGYPHLAYTIQDFAERKARKQPNINQLANLLIRSIFEDGGLGRVLSIDEVTPGTPANGWTIRFTGETNGRTADPYIAIYDGEVISYNDDPIRQPRDLSEGLALALEFAAKKGQKNCNKGKPCGGSCITKGRNCLKDKKDLTKNQQQATDAIAKAEPEKPKKNIEKRPKTKGAAGASLKASDWNPDAIPDLTPQAFGEYLNTKAQLAAQKDPESIWNQTQKESGLRTVQYRSAVSTAIGFGFIPSDAAIADAKLTKAELKQIEANRKQQEQWIKETERIDKALSYPMADEKANKNWKAQMTEEEADSYAKDSFFGSMNWYHGNNKEVTESIATEGAQPDRNRRGAYGRGVYFGIDRTIGEDYAATAPDEVEIITTRIRAKKPYIATREEVNELRERLTEFNETSDEDSVNLSRYLQAQGYDSVYLKDVGYGIAFDTKQVVTVTRENVTKQKEQLGRNIEQRAKMQVGSVPGDGKPWERNSNAQALANL